MQTNQDRLLVIQNMLFNETNMNQSLSLQDIISRLKDIFPKMKLDPRTIRKDLEILNNNGFTITEKKGSFGRILYSYEKRMFEPFEMRYLMDAIIHARFIPQQQKRKLINQIVKLSGAPYKQLLKNINLKRKSNIAFDHRLVKRLETINEAIVQQKAVRLQYGATGKIDKRSQLVLFYPYAIFCFDLYYVVGRLGETNEITHFPINQLRYIQKAKESLEKEELVSFSLDHYIYKHFYLFNGKEIEFEILFHPNLLSKVRQRFAVDYIEECNGNYLLRVKEKVTEEMVNWFVSESAQLRVLNPKKLIKYIKDRLKIAVVKYNISQKKE